MPNIEELKKIRTEIIMEACREMSLLETYLYKESSSYYNHIIIDDLLEQAETNLFSDLCFTTKLEPVTDEDLHKFLKRVKSMDKNVKFINGSNYNKYIFKKDDIYKITNENLPNNCLDKTTFIRYSYISDMATADGYQPEMLQENDCLNLQISGNVPKILRDDFDKVKVKVKEK